MTPSRSRSKPRRARAPMPPWVVADYLLGFLLGLALGVMCIDSGRRYAATTPAPPPPAHTLTHFPGP